jgi:hypothetical protein
MHSATRLSGSSPSAGARFNALRWCTCATPLPCINSPHSLHRQPAARKVWRRMRNHALLSYSRAMLVDRVGVRGSAPYKETGTKWSQVSHLSSRGSDDASTPNPDKVHPSFVIFGTLGRRNLNGWNPAMIQPAVNTRHTLAGRLRRCRDIAAAGKARSPVCRFLRAAQSPGHAATERGIGDDFHLRHRCVSPLLFAIFNSTSAWHG